MVVLKFATAPDYGGRAADVTVRIPRITLMHRVHGTQRLLFGRGIRQAIHRSVSPLAATRGSVGLLSTIIALLITSDHTGRVSSPRILATSGGPVDDARSGTLNRVTAPGSEGGAMPEVV